MVTLLKRNTIANLVGGNWPILLGIVFVPIYIKFLGIEAYGIVGFFATLTSLSGLIDLGMSATLNREMARYSAQDEKEQEQRDLARTLESIYWILSLLAGIVLLVSAPSIAHRWVNPERLTPETVEHAFLLMGAVIGLQLPSSFYQGGLMGLQRQVLVNTVLVVLATLRGIGAVLILWKVSATIEAFFLWQVCVSGVQVVIVMFLFWRCLPPSRERPRFRKNLLSGVWRYSAYVSGNAFVGVLLSQLDKIILVKILPLESFGYYSLAWTVASALWAIIVPINTALFPQFVQLHQKCDERNLVNLFHHASQVMSVAIIPVGMLLILFSREIMLLWTRNTVVAQNTYLLVSLLVLGVMLNGMSSVPAYASTAFGWPQLVMYINIGQAVVLVPGIALVVPRYGAVGAATIWVILNSTYMVVMMPILFRRYLGTEKWKWYVKDVGYPFAGVLVAGAVFWKILPGNLPAFTTLAYLGITLLMMVTTSIVLAPTVRSWVTHVVLNVKMNIFLFI
jgi:O-antigen/teichoic acid export membrane protein